MKKILKKSKHSKALVTLSGISVFALIAVFGFSILTGNTDQSNVGTSYASTQEPADINSDNTVNVFDLSILLSKWNTADTVSDLNKDGTVNVFDLSILLSKWGVVTASTTSPRSMSVGANIPLTYDVGTVTGAKIYVSPSGSDTTGDGSSTKPYQSVRKAVSAVTVTPTTILVAGGTYALAAESTNGQYTEWSKSGYTISIKALPNAVPIFDGSQAAPQTVSTEAGAGAGGASLKYFDYTTAGEGVGAGLTLSNLPKASFSGTTPTGLTATEGYRCVDATTNTYFKPTLTPTTTNPSGCASGAPYVMTAYYADQAWYNGVRLQQVLDKKLVTAGTFYVERDTIDNSTSQSTKMYVSAALDTTKLSVSSSKIQIRFSYPNASVEGLTIRNNSPGKEASFITMYGGSGADNLTLKNLVLSDNASIAIALSGRSTNALDSALVDSVTARNSGWSGLTSMYSDNLTIKGSLFSDSNLDQEFNFSPQAGGIKFSRIYKSKILGNAFENNYGAGLWYDQSNYDAQVVGNRFIDNASSAFFYEISHKLLFANNYVRSPDSAAIKSAGSGDLSFVNNTIVGGGAAIAIYTDNRSQKYDSDGDGTVDRWCSENVYRYGGTFYANCNGMTSDLNKLHLGEYGSTNDTPGMNWMPYVSLMMDNIFTDQAATSSVHSNCTYDALNVCLVAFHSSGPTTDPLYMIQAASMIDGNIYQMNDSTKRFFHLRTTTGQVCGIDVTTLTALRTAFANTSCFNKTAETNGKYSSSHQYADTNGIPTAGLDHSQAAPVPADATLNLYIPAGTKHYGAF